MHQVLLREQLLRQFSESYDCAYSSYNCFSLTTLSGAPYHVT